MVRPSSPVASRRIVCFSHKTALEILTALPPSQKPQPMRSRKFPDQAPSLKDAQLASDRVLEQCPRSPFLGPSMLQALLRLTTTAPMLSNFIAAGSRLAARACFRWVKGQG